MFKIKIYDFETKRQDGSVDAGMIMTRASDSLRVLRSLIKKHALTLGEEEEDSRETALTEDTDTDVTCM